MQAGKHVHANAGTAGAIPFDRFSAEVSAVYRPPLRARATARKVGQVLTELHRLGLQTTADLTPPTLARWIATRPDRRPATWRSLLRTARALVSYGRSQGFVARDPFQWRSPAAWLPDRDQAEGPARTHLTGAELVQILDRADRESLPGGWSQDRLRALVYTLAYTGMRRREALGLRCADLDLDRALVTIRPNARRPLKTRGSAATLALHPDLVGVLSDWLPRTGGEWLFPGTTFKGPWLEGAPGHRAPDHLRALGERAGVDGVSFFDLQAYVRNTLRVLGPVRTRTPTLAAPHPAEDSGPLPARVPRGPRADRREDPLPLTRTKGPRARGPGRPGVTNGAPRPRGSEAPPARLLLAGARPDGARRRRAALSLGAYTAGHSPEAGGRRSTRPRGGPGTGQDRPGRR